MFVFVLFVFVRGFCTRSPACSRTRVFANSSFAVPALEVELVKCLKIARMNPSSAGVGHKRCHTTSFRHRRSDELNYFDVSHQHGDRGGSVSQPILTVTSVTGGVRRVRERVRVRSCSFCSTSNTNSCVREQPCSRTVRSCSFVVLDFTNTEHWSRFPFDPLTNTSLSPGGGSRGPSRVRVLTAL